jgi:protein arginine N-methyltransferase 7
MTQDRRTPQALTETPGALIRLGCALMGSGEGAKAVALLRGLRASRPDDAELRSAERIILSHRVGRWHMAMLADQARNRAYEGAIRRAVAGGGTVLDIGTGSGLLAMMAAQAGADLVVACEQHPAIAETARDIVAANGFGDRVRVIPRRSTEIDRDMDLIGGADLIIAEIFADDLLGEGALATLRDAIGRLGRPGAKIIPASASVRVALGWRPLKIPCLGAVGGFDLSPFERHVPPERKLEAGDRKLALRSEPATLFDFDFAGGNLPRRGRTSLVLEATGGPADGIVQWIRLRLDDEHVYENRPGPDTNSHWAASFHPLPRGGVGEGGRIVLNAAHDGERLQLWTD